MIKLTKPIKRELLAIQQHGKDRGKSVIVQLTPGDELEFRTKGRRKTYAVSLWHCLRLAQIVTIESEFKSKMDDYTIARKAGRRVRKPRRPFFPFDKQYFNALKR